MKKIIFLMTASAFIFCTEAFAQQLNSGKENHENANIAKDYHQPGDVSSTSLYEVPGGFVAKYRFDDVDYRVSYDNNGRWLYTVRVYNESKLPRNMRREVKSSYPDYAIVLVEEIEKPANAYTYVVHLEGKDSWIKLRVSNGEMDEWQKFNKSF
ncbi:MAG TPA: hypothetical protein VK588_04840 [Chitinophagaceae bacterium]|nr:hypothetical protein [Chitinophagaceae bacterium]